ncbi:hypothetical protein D9619_010134 [Psilocybe cf. subviscida]|uniref:Uncharacterized protein n=1 Tax=Psilocybe cf. subviscida TaxID=2480587 RepID=A0A8H5ASW3_9AGAR|nr:hypothetical protein D9619_010134 [Psilocybe cf. subviscida]
MGPASCFTETSAGHGLLDNAYAIVEKITRQDALPEANPFQVDKNAETYWERDEYESEDESEGEGKSDDENIIPSTVKFFAFSFNTVLATLIIGTIGVTASTDADVQHDTTDVCRLANSLNSKLLAFQRIHRSDKADDIIQACSDLNSGLKTLISDAKKLQPERMSTDDTTGVCDTLEASTSAFKGVFDLFTALHPTFAEVIQPTTRDLISDAVRQLYVIFSRMESVLAQHFDLSTADSLLF